jgi:ribosomal-protein-alanine N-acetyltransferase
MNRRFLNINGQITIRHATPSDIPAIMRLERSSNSAAHWSEQQYESLVVNDHFAIARLALVGEAQEDSAILGFLIAQHIGPEWELENIVVEPTMQGKGIGTLLLNALLAHVKQANSGAVFLEVRESNKSARGLYRKLGFQETGRRKSYYGNPLEDAILHRWTQRLPDHR